MPAWVRRMSAEDVAAATRLSEAATEPELVRQAVASLKRGTLIKAWFLASCFAPVAMLLLSAAAPALVAANVWLWLAGFCASMALPIPARVAAARHVREGDIIAYAYWLKKDPSFLQKD